MHIMTTVSPPYIPTSAALPSCSPPPPPSSQPTSTSPTSSPPRAGLSAYQELSIIGEGTFGKVAKIKRISDGEVNNQNNKNTIIHIHIVCHTDFI